MLKTEPRSVMLTLPGTIPHPILLLNRGPTDGIGLGSASSCVSWPRLLLPVMFLALLKSSGKMW